MRSLSEPFEQVNAEQLIRRIYNFVSPIDAVSPTTTELQSDRCESLDFSLTTPGELHLLPGTMETTWSINGEMVVTGNSLTVFSCRLPVGSHRIEVEVRDVTTAVRWDFDDALVERFRWDLETTVSGGNRPPEPVGALPDRTLTPDGTVAADVSRAFVDPDGDPLTYVVSSSEPQVVTVLAAGARLTLTAVSEGTATIRVTASDPGGLSATQSFTVMVSQPANRPPEPMGTLPPLTIGLDEAAATVDVAGAFRDPDGDALSYGARSSSPSVASVSVLGSRVTVTPLSGGAALVTVTATDTGGTNTASTQSFVVTVVRPFTDHPIVPGETPVRAVHFTELRARIDGLRVRAGLGRFAWTDPGLRSGVTRVRLVHLLELRSALAEAYSAEGAPSPAWTDEGPVAGTTPIRAAHLMELRAAVLVLE